MQNNLKDEKKNHFSYDAFHNFHSPPNIMLKCVLG